MDKYKEIDNLIKPQLENLNISDADFDGMCTAVLDFDSEYEQLKEENHSLYYILLLAATYKAGRESVATL